ncbi:hypothetical protein OAJ50_05065 [Candidatus Nitrosopelagicus sp.]|nr:hypothetical protein [Candidatus Nitrosopelagicus sp.]
MPKWRPVVHFRQGLYEDVMQFTETYATKGQAIQGGKRMKKKWEALNKSKKGSVSTVHAVEVGKHDNNADILKVIKAERKFEFGF